MEKIISTNKKLLGDMYPIKEVTEKFVWEQLVEKNPRLGELKDLDVPINRSMYIHAFILGMFDIFKK